jgi:PIN domain nuclease of toxin-antitoxin system
VEIVDTVYLIAYLNPDDPLHREARSIVEGVGGGRRVSQAALLELDLLMKSRGFTVEERLDTWQLLSILLGRESVEPLYPEDFALAAVLAEREGMDYFDSLIAAQCINRRAKPLTSDQAIIKAVERYWEPQS